MRAPKVHGLIRRRLLLNFAADPAVVQPLLPSPFVPKLHAGSAIIGVCLIRLEDIRIKGLPAFAGVSSENAAHRIAVTWNDADTEHEGVYIPRRDTNSVFNALVGGRLFPGEHHRAAFSVAENWPQIKLAMKSFDHAVELQVSASVTEKLPRSSVFANVDEASAFFERGSLGYSATAAGDHLDGLTLKTMSWHVEPLEVEHISSSYFADKRRFPDGTVTFDCGLLMRNVDHEWHSAASLYA